MVVLAVRLEKNEGINSIDIISSKGLLKMAITHSFKLKRASKELPGVPRKYKRLNSSCEGALVSKIFISVHCINEDLT